MSVIAFPARTRFTPYVPQLDNALSKAAEILRGEIQREQSRSWINGVRDRGIDAINKAVAAAGSNGIRVAQRTTEMASALVWSLPSHVPLPDVLVEEDGEIAFDWSEGVDQSITMTINDSGFLGHSVLLGLKTDYGRAPFSGSLPEALLFDLVQMYPLPTRASKVR